MVDFLMDCHNTDSQYVLARTNMVRLLEQKGIRSRAVLDAMNSVHRHFFIPERHRETSSPYGDHPCSIGHGQTISQPYIVAYMTERLELKPGERVLEIGTGCGYQTAVLAAMGARIYSVESIPALAGLAGRTLADEGVAGVNLCCANGYLGWPEHAPYDAIIVTCAPAELPTALVDQLIQGGRMIIPVGELRQKLVFIRKTANGTEQTPDLAVRFVPMVPTS